MTDWYYHDPAEGRVGPLTAEQMRTRYRERRIQRDTLAWHQGLRDWQSLERLSEALGLDEVRPDHSLPPPLPPAARPAAEMAAATARPRPAASARPARAARQQRRGLSGCVIALIIAVVLAVLGAAVLAAIALPAYQDYAVRARAAQVAAEAEALTRRAGEYITRHRRCPGNATAGFGPANDYATTLVAAVRFGEYPGGACAIELRFRDLDNAADGRTLVFQAHPSQSPLTWACHGGTLPSRFLPAACR